MGGSGAGGLVAKSFPTLETPQTVACQAPLSMGFSRQEYWSGLLFPSPGDLPNPESEPRSPALQADSLPTELVGLSLPFILRHPAWYIGTEKFLFTCEPNISTCLPPEWVLPKLYFSFYFFHSSHSSPPNSSPACLPRASCCLPASELFMCPAARPLSTPSPQFSSVTQSFPTLRDPMNRSTPGLPVHHQLPEFTHTHIHLVSDAIQPSHPLSSPISSCPQSLPASESFPMSQLFA